MGVLRVLSARGDTTIEWDREQAQTGDPEAVAAVREAERFFAEQRAGGATSFRIAVDRRAERLDAFDPEAEQIVIVPRVAGGRVEQSAPRVGRAADEEVSALAPFNQYASPACCHSSCWRWELRC